MPVYDISQTLRQGMKVWPGDPEFKFRPVARMRDGAPSNVSALEMGVHTGTHIDAPLHIDDGESDSTRLPLHPFVGPVRVFFIRDKPSIHASDLSILDWKGVERALFKTRFEGSSEPAADRGYVSFHEDAAEFLIRKKILLVGTDAASVDAFDSEELTVHRLLLKNDIVILENAVLESVPAGDYELICLPLKIAGSDGSPVRAILRND